MFSQQFKDEIVGYALQIAKLQRNEDHLQSAKVLDDKFKAELIELRHAEEKWDEIPDLFYYAICLEAQDEPLRLQELEGW